MKIGFGHRPAHQTAAAIREADGRRRRVRLARGAARPQPRGRATLDEPAGLSGASVKWYRARVHPCSGWITHRRGASVRRGPDRGREMDDIAPPSPPPDIPASPPSSVT